MSHHSPDTFIRLLLTGDPFDLYALLHPGNYMQLQLDRSQTNIDMSVGCSKVDLVVEYPGWINLRGGGMSEMYESADIVVIVYERDGSSNMKVDHWWNVAKSTVKPGTPVYTICRSFVYRQPSVYDLELPNSQSGGERAGYRITSTEGDFMWALRHICSRYVSRINRARCVAKPMEASSSVVPVINDIVANNDGIDDDDDAPPPFFFFDEIRSDNYDERSNRKTGTCCAIL